MRNTLLKFSIIAIMLTAVSLRSTDLIVDGVGTDTNHYVTIRDAYDAAVDGDSVLLEAGMTFSGSTGNYAINVLKNLIFGKYGEGEDPVIDLTGATNYYFIAVKFGKTVSMSHLDIRNKPVGNYPVISLETDGILNVEDCSFRDNSANGDHAAVVDLYTNVVFNATRCLFQNNASTAAGVCGIVPTEISSSITFTDCIFLNNSSTFRGGVIGWSIDSSVTINAIGCTFLDNTSPSAGVIYNYGSYSSPSSFECCRFYGNSLPVFYCGVSTMSATNNWWGTNNPDFDTLLQTVDGGTITATPWAVSSIRTEPSIVAPGSTALLLADFTYNSSGQEITGCSISATPVGFSTTEGTLTATLANTVDGIATTTLIASYSGLSFKASATVGPDEEAYSLYLTVTPDPIIPGISIIKKINDSIASTQEPGVVVASDSIMDISYIITNTGNVTLNIEVTDDHTEYTVTPSIITLDPDVSATCTAQWFSPDINQLYKNIGTATGTTALSTVVTASAFAYATSIPVNPYRYNFGCICTDEGEEHILIGSHNMPELDGNSLDFWMFNETPTVSFIGSLDLGQQIIMDSATYNTGSGMNIAVLTQTQEGATAIILVTYDGVSTTSHSITPLSSQAFKAQWFVSSNGTPYIVTDEQNGMSLYEVDLNTYEMTLSSSTPNLGAGTPSVFLRWYPKSESLYVIQGYNKASIATYKVDLTVPEIQAGVPTDVEEQFMLVNSCATGYESLVLGGAESDDKALLAHCVVIETGDLVITQTATIPDVVYLVNYCERCCCADNPILVGTNNGLYTLNADTFDIVASNTSMPNEWINTCWCCDVTGDYCLAVDRDYGAYVFQQADSVLNMVLELRS